LKTVIFQQAYFPEFQEHACFDPLLETIMGGGAWTKEGGVQGFPLAPRAEDEEDGIHTNTIGGTRPTAAKAVRVFVFWQPELDFPPKFVGNSPMLGPVVIVHDLAPVLQL
jgi:hypothetical protein